MTSYLNHFTLNLPSLPNYDDFHEEFIENLDHNALNCILNHSQLFPPKVKHTAKDAITTNIQNNVISLIRNDELKVKYSQCYGIGRFYGKTITNQYKRFKHSYFNYANWCDIDMVKSHPRLILEIYRINGYNVNEVCPSIKKYVDNPEDVFIDMEDYYGNELTKPKMKDLYNSMIYGGTHKKWVDELRNPPDDGNHIRTPIKLKKSKPRAFEEEFKKECAGYINLIYNSNPDLVKRLCDDCSNEKKLTDLWDKKKRTVSFYLQFFENDALYHLYQFLVSNQVITPRRCSLEKDGLCFKIDPNHIPTDNLIEKANDYTLDKTGMNILWKIKPYEPENYIENLNVSGEETDPYLIWKDKFEKRHFKVNNMKCFIKVDYEYNSTDIKSFTHFNRTDLMTVYENQTFQKTVIRGKGTMTIEKSYIKEWLKDPTIRTYDECDIIPPPLVCPPNIYNMWIPSKFHGADISQDDAEYNKEAVELWLNHIHILCNEEPEVTDYMIKWFAHLLQKPHEKSTCITMLGEEGTGKNISIEPIVEIMGGKKLETTTPERDVWGSFNGLMETSLLVLLSEVDKSNSYGAEGKIKGLITDPTMVINKKGVSSYVIKSHHRFIKFSNNCDPTKTSKGDRRNVIIKTGSKWKGNFGYFKKYVNTFKERKNLLSLYSYLIRLPIDKWDFKKLPISDYHKTLIEQNRSQLDVFMEWWVLQQPEDTDVRSVVGGELYSAFKIWKNDNGGGFEINGAGDLVKKIKCAIGLPNDCITEGQRTKKGRPSDYHINKLRSHYKIDVNLLMEENHTDEEEFEIDE